MSSSASALHVSDPILTLPFMFPGLMPTTTVPSFPIRESETVVEGTSGDPSLL